MSDEETMNVRDVARRLGVHENTVRNWADRGFLAYMKLPGFGYRRFSRTDVEEVHSEMWSQFAPAKPLNPRLVPEDYND